MSAKLPRAVAIFSRAKKLKASFCSSFFFLSSFFPSSFSGHNPEVGVLSFHALTFSPFFRYFSDSFLSKSAKDIVASREIALGRGYDCQGSPLSGPDRPNPSERGQAQ